MRILMLTYEIKGRGGSYQRSLSLGKAVASLGHSVTLLAASQDRAKTTREHGIEIIEMPHMLPARMRHGGVDPVDLVQRMWHVRGTHYDVVHSFGHRPTASVPAMVTQNDSLWVADWADLWGGAGIAQTRPAAARAVLERIDGWGERAVYSQARGVTVINQALLDAACSLGVDESCIRIVPVGCNADLITPQDKVMARAKLGLPTDKPVVVYLGMAAYDAAYLAESVVALLRLNPSVMVLMAGPPMPEFNRIVSEAGIDERIINLGVVPYDQVAEVLGCGDVMLLPYRDTAVNRGRYPNKTGDYLAAGRPIVTNPTGDVGRLVQDEEVGLVADESPEAFASAVNGLLLDEPLRTRLGVNARRLAEAKLSWVSLATRLVEFYEVLLASSRRESQ